MSATTHFQALGCAPGAWITVAKLQNNPPGCLDFDFDLNLDFDVDENAIDETIASK